MEDLVDGDEGVLRLRNILTLLPAVPDEQLGPAMRVGTAIEIDSTPSALPRPWVEEVLQ